jgi:hypothetical protein
VQAVDWDPYTTGADETFDVVYGDAEDIEFPGSLPLSSASWVVSTLPRVDTSRHLVAALREWEFTGEVALLANSDADAERLSDTGATIILKPYRDAARAGVDLILNHADSPNATERSSG